MSSVEIAQAPITSDTDFEAIPGLVRQLLQAIGEDPDRDGLVKTPRRVASTYEFLTQGYHQNIQEVLGDALFEETCDEMVIVRDIDFASLCEHHLLPFFGRAHVAYIPNGKIIGISKIPRIVDVFSRRLQVQERLTNQIATTIENLIQPLGVAVTMDAEHLCMKIRGVEKQNTRMITSSMRGTFRREGDCRAEFLNLIGRPTH